MKIRFAPIICFLVLALFAAVSGGCTSAKKDTAQVPKTKRAGDTGHTASSKEKTKIVQSAKKAMALLEQVRDDTSVLDTFLAEPLKKRTAAQIDADSLAGRIKIRKLTDSKYVFNSAINDVAGVEMTYKDDSYYVDKNGKRLTEASGSSKKLSLELRKVSGKWKISNVLGKIKEMPTQAATQSPSVKKN